MALGAQEKEAFVLWLEDRLTRAGRGDDSFQLEQEPSSCFWLGRLASEERVLRTATSERGERLEPCALGFRFMATSDWLPDFQVRIRFVAWIRRDRTWHKTAPVEATVRTSGRLHPGTIELGKREVTDALARAGAPGLSAEIRVEVEQLGEAFEYTVLFVNTSPADPISNADSTIDCRLYECSIEALDLQVEPYLLEALPDSFRFDRRVPAYGVNCGIEVRGTILRTVDGVGVSKLRPNYWGSSEPQPSLAFDDLAEEPALPVGLLSRSFDHWVQRAWSEEALLQRSIAESWSPSMLEEALAEARLAGIEAERLRRGVDLLSADAQLCRAFRLMNAAMAICSRGRYSSWRPFQVGFLLANLTSIAAPESESHIVDIVWFSTGGGKTETYLGLLLTAAFHDRLRGKKSGITAWSRFPLRLLSLQQIQRFADALAAAEIVRLKENLGGDPFALGFFVGDGSTPNRIADGEGGQWDAEDETVPQRCRVLHHCPFCRSDRIDMRFDRVLWKLEHICGNSECSWNQMPLPIHVVDEEIYRFLPTVIVGTLDKAASISKQAAMRGFVGSPLGVCSRPGHGFTYAPRSTKPNGCLVPGCRGKQTPLPMSPELYAPGFRLQDELHLLRDSLGAVDSHYEALYDGLQAEISGRTPKILASSATLAGYARQAEVLYRREARVFPHPGPRSGEGFWANESGNLMRRFVSLAPRGVTLEYVVDRTLTELQRTVRRLTEEPRAVCEEIGIDPSHSDQLLEIYGTTVVYGNTLRDLDAVLRSVNSGQVAVAPLNIEPLTGRSDFEQVRRVLDRLEAPEVDFGERIHVITGSSMMSHGVDLERLNVMIMVGFPLTTAEFIQATARVGRTHPGLVIVLPKMGRERDAGLYRAFDHFVRHGDRFVEPIPITNRSRRVLKRTVSGLALARILMIHEAAAASSLTTIHSLRQYLEKTAGWEGRELEAMKRYLALETIRDHNLLDDLADWWEHFRENLVNPPSGRARFPSDASPTGEPMLSLRDVEEQVEIHLWERHRNG